MISKNFWAGKRVLLTGHTGFKGGWLSLWLRRLGAEVTGLALPPETTPNLFEIARIGEEVTSLIGDIRSQETIVRAVKAAEPEVVIHMAAQALVRRSYLSPVETFHTNVMGTANLLDAIRHASSVRSVVIVTSDKCYENREWVWGYRESDPMGGYDPYSSSKGCAELVTAAFRSSFFPFEGYGHGHHVGLASARAGNVIGGGDWAADRLVPDIIRAITAGEPVRIRSPRAVRPWQHVLEPLSGYLVLAEQLFHGGPEAPGAWNFGPYESDARPVAWIADHLTTRWGDNARWVIDVQDNVHEANCLKLDCSKARSKLGWEPRWSLEQALDRIVAWHRAFQKGNDMRAHSFKDIDDYMLSSQSGLSSAAKIAEI